MGSNMKIIIGCEYSGRARRAFHAAGHEVYSVDLLESEDGSPNHRVMDVIEAAYGEHWDMGIFHPPCTRLANSGVRWLHTPPPGKTKEQMWQELDAACKFYRMIRDAPIAKKAIENPVMHKYARERIGEIRRQIVQPWWFGDPAFKATGFELFGLPDLKKTHELVPPKKGTKEHDQWSEVHRASPSPTRWKERSRTYPGLAAAMAAQWG